MLKFILVKKESQMNFKDIEDKKINSQNWSQTNCSACSWEKQKKINKTDEIIARIFSKVEPNWCTFLDFLNMISRKKASFVAQSSFIPPVRSGLKQHYDVT